MVKLDELAVFVDGAQAICDKYMEENFPNSDPLVLDAKVSKKYAKIVRYRQNKKTGELHSGSVHCFVDMTNGDVLKAASFKAPVQGVRGNIYNEDDGLSCMNEYGVNYLR